MALTCPICNGQLAAGDDDDALVCRDDSQHIYTLLWANDAEMAALRAPVVSAPAAGEGDVPTLRPMRTATAVAAPSPTEASSQTLALRPPPPRTGPPAFAPRIARPSAPAESRHSVGTCDYHPTEQAYNRCVVCTRPMCDVCTFDIESGARMCPDCASSPVQSMSGKRWTLVLLAYGVGIFAFVIMSALSFLPEVVGTYMLIWGAPSVGAAGLGLGCLALDKRMGNTTLVWGAVGLNVVFMLAVIGQLMFNVMSGFMI